MNVKQPDRVKGSSLMTKVFRYEQNVVMGGMRMPGMSKRLVSEMSRLGSEPPKNVRAFAIVCIRCKLTECAE